MTNAILLALSLFTTNTFPIGAKDDYSIWSAEYCWNVQMTYAVPASLTPSVWVVEYTWTPQGVTVKSNGPNGTLYSGMNWTVLNCTTNLVFNDYPDLDLGHFTNTWTSTAQTNTIRLPIPPGDMWFFRLRRVQ